MRVIFATVFLLVAATLAAGGTLVEFKDRIRSVRTDIAELIDISTESDPSDPEVRDFQDKIRDRLVRPEPKLRTVEFGSSSIELDTRWIAAKFKLIEEDPSRLIDVISEIDERLQSIEQATDELLKAEASNRSKDEEKSKLAEILTRPEFQKPEAESESLLDRIMKAIDKWLRENFPEPNIPDSAPEGLRTTSLIFQIILYGVIIAAVGFLLFRFAPFIMAKFGGLERESKIDRVILGERVAGHEDAGTLFSEAERLAREGNLRGAVRKGYIALLCELSDRRMIALAHHKTNRDYLRDVRKHTPLHREMNGLTNSFERHWYGFDEVSAEDWQDFREGYKQTMESARNRQNT